MIDKLAVIDSSAQIASDVMIGPWVKIGPNVVIESGCQIGSHVLIAENTTIGSNTHIYSHAVLGTDPQHMDFKEETTSLVIGKDNVIREFVSINRGTLAGHGKTIIGDHNYFMSYSHIAHDCRVGNHTIFANLAQIAGHVEVGNHAILAAYAGIHQFCRIGAFTFLGRATKVFQDILPYMMVIGNPGGPCNLNLVGLRRNGFSREAISRLKQAFSIIKNRGLGKDQMIAELEPLSQNSPEVATILNMITTSTRGIARAARAMSRTESLNDF